MIDGYETKEMKPAETKEAPVVHQSGSVYEEKGLWYFKVGGQLYQYRTEEMAKAGLLIVNG